MILEGLAHIAYDRLIRILGQRVQGLHGLQVRKHQAIVVQHELVFEGVFLLQRVSLGLDRLDAVDQVIIDYLEILQLLFIHEKRLASSLIDL